MIDIRIGQQYHLKPFEEVEDHIFITKPTWDRLATGPVRVVGIHMCIAKVETSDPVHHPAHYNYGKIEVIDFILDKNLSFNLGNVVKYVARAGHKGDAIRDLEKAKQYIDFEIQHLKGER